MTIQSHKLPEPLHKHQAQIFTPLILDRLLYELLRLLAVTSEAQPITMLGSVFFAIHCAHDMQQIRTHVCTTLYEHCSIIL